MIKLFLLALILTQQFGTLFLATDQSSQQASKSALPQSITEKCLGCHGPYEKIARATSNFKMPSGEIVTPHQYVPHADKKDIPDCVECHLVHATPVDDTSKVIKPTNAEWCYKSCHHANNLQPCQECHTK